MSTSYVLERYKLEFFFGFMHWSDPTFPNLQRWHTQSYDNLIDLVISFLISSGANIISFTKLFRKPPTPWWDDDCLSNFLVKKENFRKYLNHPCSNNLELYLTCCKVFSYLVRRKKRSSFRSFCSKIDFSSDINSLWRTLKAFQNSNTCSRDIFNRNNVDITGFYAVFDKIAPPNGCAHMSATHNSDLNVPVSNSSPANFFLNSSLSEKEYFAVLSTVKVNSASGPDLISNRINFHFPHHLHIILLDLFNIMLENSIFPLQWQQYYVVFIPKPGRKDSYRSISLASNILKLLGKINCRRLDWWAENNMLIPHFQFGFRRGLACVDNIASFVSNIKLATNNKKVTGVVFLDINCAFDNVVPSILLQMLVNMGLPLKLINFISSVISSRHLSGYMSGSLIHSRTTNIGLPQGSVLSPYFLTFIYLKLNPVFPFLSKFSCTLMILSSFVLIHL